MNVSSKKIEGEPKPKWSLGQWWAQMTYRTWWERNIEFPWNDFRTGVRNIIKWMPIVWKDRDLDDAYIMYALRFKIRNTRDRLLRNNRIEGLEQIERDTTTCIKLIDRFLDETYSMEYLDYKKSDFNWVPFSDPKNGDSDLLK